MQFVRQSIFAVITLLLAWVTMTTTHELGHVIGALLTGGHICEVRLTPWTISSTLVDPNPHPGTVVWSGPLIGCLIPAGVAGVRFSSNIATKLLLRWLAGFCLIANGAYIAFGSFEGIGDCRAMYQTGTSQITMLLFGTAAILSGMLIWHRLGNLQLLLRRSQLITIRLIAGVGVSLALVVMLQFLLMMVFRR
jgi:hypothetical protein